jgi:hypothetical protein
MIEMHSRSVAYAEEETQQQPFECLAGALGAGALLYVHRVRDCDYVHNEDHMTNRVEQLVTDGAAKVGGPPNNQEKNRNDVPGDHDFRCEFVTEGLLDIQAKESKDCEEEDYS